MGLRDRLKELNDEHREMSDRLDVQEDATRALEVRVTDVEKKSRLAVKRLRRELELFKRGAAT